MSIVVANSLKPKERRLTAAGTSGYNTRGRLTNLFHLNFFCLVEIQVLVMGVRLSPTADASLTSPNEMVPGHPPAAEHTVERIVEDARAIALEIPMADPSERVGQDGSKHEDPAATLGDRQRDRAQTE